MDRYRLEPLRAVRENADRAKRNDLAAAVGDARKTSADVAAAQRRIDDARAALAAALTSRSDLSASHLLALADRLIARRRRQLDDAVVMYARARDAHAGRLATVESARGQMTAARADKELVERHFARWRQTRQKLAERRED